MSNVREKRLNKLFSLELGAFVEEGYKLKQILVNQGPDIHFSQYRNEFTFEDLNPFEFIYSFKLGFHEVFNEDFLIQQYLGTYNEPENEIRSLFGLPKVGEGWISDTNLFYEIKEHFARDLVMHHGKPAWLGKQHLDIYLPKYNIAVEFQGDQHFQPIEYFGGEQSLAANKERDKKKAALGKENRCSLIYVKPDYDLPK